MGEVFDKSFYEQTALDLAPQLLGQILVHDSEDGVAFGYIMETEAYMGATDRASHAYSGEPTHRTQILFEGVGLSYVFQIYGIHYLFNVTCGPPRLPECVLIRALEPLGGLDLMCDRHGTYIKKNLTNGPGKLCKALGINETHYGLDITNSQLRIEKGRYIPDKLIAAGERVNIDYAGDDALLPWRFWVNGSAYVSK